ncbi:hypothetical protein ACKGJI_01090 [Sulfurospirillum sp. 1307]
MENVRYVNAPLSLIYDENINEDYKREFDSLSGSDDDSVGEWLRLAKARGETNESDQVLLTLVLELHRKIDSLNAYIKGEEKKLLSLTCKAQIEAIGYEHFMLKDDDLEIGKSYYGRLDMPFFPKREVPVFFTAISNKEAKIELFHERDEKDWNAYVVARERVMIREMRAKK